MEKLEGKDRSALFRTVICFFDGNQMKTFIGEINGKIAEEFGQDGTKQLVYDKLFIPKGKNDTFSSLCIKEKNLLSHRVRATRKFAEWFKKKSLQ